MDEFHNDYQEFHEKESEPSVKKEEDNLSSERNRHLAIPSAQVLATTFVALIVVTAVLIPALDNRDVEVYLDGELISDQLYFMASMSYYSEDTPYYIIVIRDGSILHQQVIDDGFAKGNIDADPEGRYTLEVRSGSPPLLVIASKEVYNESGIWAELLYLNVETSTADFGVELHGSGASAYVSIYDTVSMTTVYSNEMGEGKLEDSVSGLSSGTLYYLTVSTEEETYLFEEFTTKTG